MLDEHGSVKLAKWPFYLADLLLSGVVVFVLYQLGTFQGTGEMLIVGGCLVVAAVAAWISIIPWLKEHEGRVHLNESSNLKSSVEQIKGIEKVADLIRQSNTQWQGIQDASSRTIASAREITERMKVEADEFMKFMASAQDQERAGLRLEVEKLRRMEGDWIKVSVQILDHVYALHRAAERSGQRNLISQLTHFQNACREAARRMGLVPFLPEIGENFDVRAHQLTDPKHAPAEGARVGDVLAPGFTYQGQLLRRSLVLLEGAGPEPHAALTEEKGQVAEPEVPAGAEVAESFAEPSKEPSAELQALTAENENPEIASDVEVFEEIDRSESSADSAESQNAEALPPEPEDRAKKKSPQEELPF